MADIQQVWEGRDGWKVLSLHYYVHQDFGQQPDISKAFDLIISARVLGAQIGQVILQPLQKTDPLTIPLVGGVAGTIKGKLDNWQGYFPDGTPAPSWSQGGLASAQFLLTLDINITVPVPILGKIPIQVSAFHKPCTVLLHWDATTNKYLYTPTAV